MEILDATREEVPGPLKRNDYGKIAELYNQMEVGQALRLAKVYNITLFRQSLERRGLTATDAKVYQKGNHCFIKKVSVSQMAG